MMWTVLSPMPYLLLRKTKNPRSSVRFPLRAVLLPKLMMIIVLELVDNIMSKAKGKGKGKDKDNLTAEQQLID